MLCNKPNCLAQVTWKAVKQFRFSHWMQAPTLSLHNEQTYKVVRSSIERDCRWDGVLASFHLPFGTNSTDSTGSIYMEFPRVVSGIQIAHSKWAHWPVVVCLKAPPSLGQNMQDWWLPAGLSAELPGNAVRKTYYRVFRRDCTLATKPLALRDIWYTVTVYNEVMDIVWTQNDVAYLDGPPSYTRHRTQSRSNFLPHHHRRWSI